MAAVLPTQTIHSHQSAHFLTPRPSHHQWTARRSVGNSKQQQQPQQYQQNHGQHHGGFEAFAPHHHSGARSLASVSDSWRTHVHVQSLASAPVSASPSRPSPVRHRSADPARPTSVPNLTPSSSSPAVHIATLSESKTKTKTEAKTETAPSFVYTPADLLRLSRSPLVGVSAQKLAVLRDLVEHNVWRRGPSTSRSRSPRSPNNSASNNSYGNNSTNNTNKGRGHRRRASSSARSSGSSSGGCDNSSCGSSTCAHSDSE